MSAEWCCRQGDEGDHEDELAAVGSGDEAQRGNDVLPEAGCPDAERPGRLSGSCSTRTNASGTIDATGT